MNSRHIEPIRMGSEGSKDKIVGDFIVSVNANIS